MTVSCTSETCDNKVPYRDQVVLQVVLQGMCDKDVRARTLTQTANRKLNKPAEVVEYTAAEEAGIMHSKDICQESVDDSGVRNSAYKRGEGRGSGASRRRTKEENIKDLYLMIQQAH